MALTWPLVLHPATAVSDFGDPLLTAWILDWVCYALTHQPLSLYDAPIFHPAPVPLAYSENLIAVAILVLPAYLAGVPPIAVHNLAVLLGFALSGYGAYVLARMVSGSTIGAIAGGIFFAFCSFKFDHLPHVHILFSAWVPLLLAALLAFWEKPNRWRGALLTLAWVANGLTNIYFLLFTAVAMIFTVLLLGIIRPRGWRFYAGLAATTIAAVLILYPFLKPYREVSQRYKHVRTIEEVRNGSASWKNWLVPSWSSRAYGNIPAYKMFEAERQLFPGLMIVFLTLTAVAATPRLRAASDELRGPPREEALATGPHIGAALFIFAALALAWATAVSDRYELKLFGRRVLAADSADIPAMVALLGALFAFRRQIRAFAERSRFNAGAWTAAVWIAVGLLGSFGANGFLYTFFYRRFEPFQAMRVPARFAVIAYAGLAVWGALGVAAVLRNRTGWKRPVFAILILALMVVEVVPRTRWEYLPRETPPVYGWLARTRVGPVVEFPFSTEGVDYRYVLGSTAHHVKLVNGTSGFFPAEWWKLRDADSRDAFDEMLDGLEQNGTKVVIVHGDFLSGERHKKIADWLRPNLAKGRLAFLRRFDNEIFGDYVFAITRNLPDWQRHRAPETPDPAGNLPSQNLVRFLDYKATHSEAIMIWVEGPGMYEMVKGPLRVRGWTMSPHGIRRVTLFLQNEKLRFDATRVERPDVKAVYPWMYLNDKPGFDVVVPERPANIRRDTSLIVEVEDHAGRVRRGRHVSFAWERSDDAYK
ncbi:MAG: hypothetical protein ACXWH7_10280 [Thermoanaerobaculia bacterium]